MTHRINTPMNAMQATPRNAAPHRLFAQARATQLSKRHDAMLPCRKLGY